MDELDEGLEVLAAGIRAGLWAHRGSILMDRRYHCVCGWISDAQADSRTDPHLGLADVRDHIGAGVLVGLATKVQTEFTENDGEASSHG